MGNNNDGEKKEVKLLRLDRSRTARAFEAKESLWDDEINRMLNLIQTHVNTLRKLPKDLDKEKKPLLSIGIFGTPGSGKTSLLQTFVNKARSNKPEDDPKKEFVQIESLPVIRPNNVAKDDHFLYSFLANALKEDREMNESSSDKFRDSPVLSPLQQSFQEVSQYLQVINPAEESQEDDPLGKSLERLERHESGLLLIKTMADFIEKLVDMKTGGKKSAVVLLPVDDVDMSLDILVSALDTYWRYLKHPRLVPLFTFTGRLAEELLRVHYESKLTLKGRLDSSQELKEAATSLMLTENMAIQYLGRLFPVRNRIRVGLAAARVLRAEYTKSISSKYDTEQKDSNKQEPKKVLDLLETVSRLLFGHSGSFAPKIRAPLRMVTLRRQIQIVDAMQEAGIDELIEKINGENSNHEKSWAQLFDLGTWTLLNAHRDIMREINMYLDDLYGWTPQGLRLVLRESILSLDLKKRRKLLTKWRYRTEGRRTQMFSLLAANTFRPWMEGIEPTGDDIDKFPQWERDEKKEYPLSFPVRDGVIWFLDLCIGFYLPLIVGCNFPDNPIKNQKVDNTVHLTVNVNKDEKEKERSADSITAIGWDFDSGPLHAIREALFNKDIFFSGMLFIESEIMKTIIDDINKKINEGKDFNDEKFYKDFLVYFFCYYGYDGEGSWASVSFWRALGLIVQLLKLKSIVQPDSTRQQDAGGQGNSPNKSDTGKEEENKIEEERKNRQKEIISILKNHVKSSQVIGSPPKRWEAIENKAREKFTELEKICDFLKPLAHKIENWLDDIEQRKESIYPLLRTEDWKTCFISRLHGESIVGEFWRELDNVYFKFQPLTDELTNVDTVKEVIKGWATVLKKYWDCNSICEGDNKSPSNGGKKKPDDENRDSTDDCSKTGESYSSLVQKMLMDCPILKPFI